MRLIIVDPHLSTRSPSMSGIVRALPALKAQGWQLEAWCWHSDPGLPLDRIVRLPTFGNLPVLASHAFTLWATLYALWRTCTAPRQRRDEVRYTVASYLPFCDIAHVHFSCWDWEHAQQRLPTRTLRDWYERLTNLGGLIAAELFFRITTARTVLCVSHGVADDVRKKAPRLNLHVLPNSYDPQRFNPTTRHSLRNAARLRHGYTERDIVFNFTSTGHYRRKGFLLAAQAIQRLQARGHTTARLHVVGGTDRHRAELAQQLTTLDPDWPRYITFAGATPHVEAEFAASDAFLFPSHSEAFGLVTLEAAASGLPLFLTRHQGAAMMLKDGINGRYLEPNAEAIADVLTDFITGAWKPQPTTLDHALDSTTYAARFIEHIKAIA